MNQTEFLPCAVIPVYNHTIRLKGVVDALANAGLPVILVDDGSSTECRQFLEELDSGSANISLKRHGQNQGKGAAVKTGLATAAELGYSHALQVDADGQHNLDDLPVFIETARQNPQALIAGFPAYDDSVPGHRYYGRYLTHVWIWINTLSFEIVDSMCGFRVYPLAASNSLLGSCNTGDRMDFDSEFIVRWFWQGLPLQQLATRVIYPEEGISHFRLFRDNVLISCMHAKLFFGMLLRLPRLLARKWNKS